jgi:hypothetical protein
MRCKVEDHRAWGRCLFGNGLPQKEGGLLEFLVRARMRRACLLVGLAFAAVPVGSALAQTPSVFAGYADGLRTNSSTHPSPWQGDAGVDFVGCNYFTPENCPKAPNGVIAYDGGALMLVNGTNQAMTVTNASVTIGTCTFEPWPGLDATVNPGNKLILTMTGGPTPCGLDVVGSDNFDTSETNAARGSGSCTNDGLIPEFGVTVNRTALAYRDTSQTLNDGGTDPGECNGSSETRPWAPMSPGVVLAPPPSTTQTSTTQTSTTQTSTTQTPPRGTAPILSAFRASPPGLLLGGRLVGGRCVKPTGKNRTHQYCTRPIAFGLGYRLNSAAAVVFTLTRLEPGRKVNGRCLNVTRQNHRHAACTRWIRLPGAVIHQSTAGSNTFTLYGPMSGTTLYPGTYQLTATPIANGSTGRPQTVTVNLVG